MPASSILSGGRPFLFQQLIHFLLDSGIVISGFCEFTLPGRANTPPACDHLASDGFQIGVPAGLLISVCFLKSGSRLAAILAVCNKPICLLEGKELCIGSGSEICIRQMGIEQIWYDYRDDAYKKMAARRCGR